MKFLCLKSLLILGIFAPTLETFSEEPSFREVDASHSSSAFREQISNALSYLKNSPHEIAKETLRSIHLGLVHIDEICDLTLSDFKQVINDYQAEGTPLALTESDYPKLQSRESVACRVLQEHLSGYQWENRIYVSLSQSKKNLALTLVHEVNHVINRSHISYYRSDLDAFLEEYRAFYVENIVAGYDMQDPTILKRIKLKIVEDYGFRRELLSEVPDYPLGVLVPTQRAWKKAGF